MSDKKANVKGFFKKFKESREQKEHGQSGQNGPSQDGVESLVTQASRDAHEQQVATQRNLAHFASSYNFSPVDPREHASLLPPAKDSDKGKPLLVLDLDETLVHSSFKPVATPNMILPIDIDGCMYQVYVKKRPYLDEFMNKICGMFEICVFTASLSKYADPLLDELDPGKKLLGDLRLFREHCSQTNQAYVKDLSLMGRPLHRICIIDNTPVAYLFQPRNALPCRSWFDDPNDTELIDFFPILDKLAECSSVYDVLDSL